MLIILVVARLGSEHLNGGTVTSSEMNRREMLLHGLGTAVALAGGGYSLALGAEQIEVHGVPLKQAIHPFTFDMNVATYYNRKTAVRHI